MLTATRQTLRGLWRDKAFSLTALAILGLGIGATTAMFSVVNSVLLQPLSYDDPDRLHAVYANVSEVAEIYPRMFVNGRHYAEWRASCSACEAITAFRFGRPNLTDGGVPIAVNSLRVSEGFLRTVGMSPIVGRGFAPEDHQPGAERVALLSAGLWRSRFQADSSILGRSLKLDGRPTTVIGVLSASFRFDTGTVYSRNLGAMPQQPQVVVPSRRAYESMHPAREHNFGALVRLREGSTSEAAMAEMDAATRELSRENGFEAITKLMPLTESVVGESRRGLWLLLGGVAVLLLVVCVNLGNLMLARAERRMREVAVRQALGAGRFQLMLGALGESVFLSVAGGGLGLLFAYWVVDFLVATAPIEIPRLDEIRVDGSGLLAALAATAFTAVAAALLPVVRMSGARPQHALRERQKGQTDSGSRLRDLLVGVQVSLSATLLVVAGLLLASLFRLVGVDKGFETQNIISFQVVLPNVDYPNKESSLAFHQRVLDQLQAEPGVVSAGLTSKLPLDGTAWGDALYSPGKSEPHFISDFRFVSADYLQSVGVPLLRGRHLEEADRGRADVGLVSKSVADAVWPGENPIGKIFRRGFGEDRPLMRVVGVVADVRAASLDEKTVPTAYEPFWYRGLPAVRYTVRTRTGPAPFVARVQELVRGIDSTLPVSDIRTMDQIVAKSVSQERFQSMLASGFALAALLLASLGIYGVVSYSVARRTNEIGLRMAIGADEGNVRAMVLRQGLRPIVFGLMVGLGAALAVGRLIESLLFGVSSRDPMTFGVTAVLLVAVGLAACYFPARRAAALSPSIALRHE